MKQKQIMWTVIAAIVVIAIIGSVIFRKKGTGTDYTGKRVSVDYIGTYTSGQVFDTNLEAVAKENGLYTANRPYTPLVFVVGSGQVVAGFENAVNGMHVGETKKVTIEPKDAYGDYDDKKIATLPKSVFEEANVQPTVGQTYQMGGQIIKVLALTETGVNIDANHPMAGQTLNFEITLKTVE